MLWVRFRVLGYLLLFLVLANQARAQDNLRFIENKNQWPKFVDYGARVPGGFVFFEPGRWRFSFADEAEIQRRHERSHHPFREVAVPGDSQDCIDAESFDLIFPGSDVQSKPIPFGISMATFNYFIGKDEASWATGAHAFEGFIYPEFYPGIDMRVSSAGRNLKYDFIVSPSSDPQTIQLYYSGAQARLEGNELSIAGIRTNIREMSPVAYQLVNGKKVYVPCHFKVVGETIGFDFPRGYDSCYELVIDPLLIFSTYSGSTADNWGSSATPGEHGNLYSTGVTTLVRLGTFPATAGAFQVNYGGLYDVAILKYDSLGQHLLYASYLGGAENESPHSIVMNQQEELLVLGTTGSVDFPTTSGAISRTYKGGTSDENVIEYHNGSDIFVTRISKNGQQILASTFIGGSANDGLNPTGSPLVKNYGDQLRGDILADALGNIFISTVTSSTNFPATHSFDTTYNGGSTDAVVMKLKGDLTQMLWGAFLGGSGTDAAHTIKLDHNGNVFVAGGTTSSNFPVPAGAYQHTQAGDADGWIAHLDKDGMSIMSATFTGTPLYNQVYFLDINQQDEVYVYGQTVGSFPVTAGVYNNPNSGQFVQKFDNALTQLQFSTVFGTGIGIPNISPTAFLVNDCNNLFMTGWGGLLNAYEGFWFSSTEGMPITSNAYQKTTSGSDFYFMVLTDDAKQFLYGTFLGGPNSKTHVDGGTSRFDKKGVVYHAVCSGCVSLNTQFGPTSDFPTTPGAYSHLNKSDNCNNAAFKFDLSSLRAIIQTNSIHLDHPGLNEVCLPDKLVFQNHSAGGQTFEWTLADGTVLTKPDTGMVIHQYKGPGTFHVKLKAIDSETCIGVDSTFVTVNVYAPQGKAGPDQAICGGAQTQLSGSGGINYEWKSQNGQFTSVDEAPFIKPDSTTAYFVSITDSHGCVVKDTLNVRVVPNPNLDFQMSRKFDCINRPTIQFSNTTKSPENWTFDFGDGTTTTEKAGSHEFQADGNYTIRLLKNSEFCLFDKSETFDIRELKVPNVITPGSTGYNDSFEIWYGAAPLTQAGIKSSVTIVNRWGAKVLQSNDYQNDWHGENVPAGVYYYQVVVEGETTCKGWLQVIK